MNPTGSEEEQRKLTVEEVRMNRFKRQPPQPSEDADLCRRSQKLGEWREQSQPGLENPEEFTARMSKGSRSLCVPGTVSQFLFGDCRCTPSSDRPPPTPRLPLSLPLSTHWALVLCHTLCWGLGTGGRTATVSSLRGPCHHSLCPVCWVASP